jgi:MYXO-CTERM domain-containing protein/uncharacterized repeat protein (TIGR01451 family)
LGCCLALPAFTLAQQAHADSELRFSQTAAGNVVATGNALGLSKETDANGPGLRDSIGTFICLDETAVDDDPSNPDNPWFGGTTNDWTENGSAADLVLPDRSEVLYAELLWGGSWGYFEDVSAHVDDPITLSFGNDSMDVTPDPSTGLFTQFQAGGAFPAHYYMRSADVTEFVQTHGAGSYAASGIPATQYHLINTLNAAGWTLVVAYRNSGEPIRNLTVFVGGSFVDEHAVEDYFFEGFCTPPSGDVHGRIVISAIEGDANLVGDSIAIAADDSDPDAFVTLSGPNNPADNFFASQLNGPDGTVDTSGTFGMRNHDAAEGENVEGGRQSWDVTSVPVSSDDGHLTAGQTTAVLRTQTEGDSYIPTLAGFAIRVNSPDFSGDGNGAGAAPEAVSLDDTSTVSVGLENEGMVAATDLVFRAPLPEGLELESFSIGGDAGDINGDPVDGAALENGVAIGDVGPGETLALELVVRSVGAPTDPSGDYIIMPSWDYDYISCVGEDPLTEPHATPPVVIEFVEEPEPGDDTEGLDDTGTSDSASASASDTSDSASASAGDSDTDSDSLGDGTGDSDSRGAAEDSDGCGCTTTQPRAPWALALLGGLALFGRRRRVHRHG